MSGDPRVACPPTSDAVCLMYLTQVLVVHGWQHLQGVVSHRRRNLLLCVHTTYAACVIACDPPQACTQPHLGTCTSTEEEGPGWVA